MSFLATLATQTTDIDTQEKDVLGGGANTVDSGVYDAVIEVAYMKKAASGAVAIHYDFKLGTGQVLSKDVYITSGTAKGCLPYYVDKNGNKKSLPGYVLANSIAQLSVGKELHELEEEEKVVSIYNYDAGKELPTQVPVLVDLLNQSVKLGIVKQTVDKRSKGDDGNYHPTGETREENDVVKAFNENGLTKTELDAGETTPVFMNKWADKYKDLVLDKSSKDSKAIASGAPNKPTSKEPVASLFS